MLFHLGYASTETRHLSSSELLELLEVARDTNEKLDLTGLLLHREHSFFQVLEGPEEVVRVLYQRIHRDRRHHRVELLFEGPIDAREFTDWRMGFVQLDDIDVSKLPGFSRYLEQGMDTREMFHEMSKTRRLMAMFRDMV
jgi:hypothetical protein